MGQDLIDFAHARLSALAQQRRRDAQQLAPLHRLSRRRLQEEVARRHAGAGRLREPVPGTERRWVWARGWLAWLAVGAAVAVLVFVIRFPWEPDAAEVRLASRSAADAASGAPAAVASAPVAPPPASAPAGAARAASDEALMASPTSLAVARTVGDAGGSRGVDLSAAQFVRQRFTSVALRGEALPVLGTFQIIRDGHAVALLEPDGSMYQGRVTPIQSTEGDVRVWVFEGQGFSERLRRAVVITGNFEAPEEAAEVGSPGAKAGAFLRHPLTATLLIQGQGTVDIRAVPAAP